MRNEGHGECEGGFGLVSGGVVGRIALLSLFFGRDVAVSMDSTEPPPCAPTNGRPGFPFGFLDAGGRLPKAGRGRVFIV